MQGEKKLSIILMSKAAQLLGVSAPTMSRYIRNGEIKATYRKQGKKLFVLIPIEEMKQKYPEIKIPADMIHQVPASETVETKEMEKKYQGYITEDIKMAIRQTEQGLMRLKSLIRDQINQDIKKDTERRQ